jgi:hypothetical protein
VLPPGLSGWDWRDSMVNELPFDDVKNWFLALSRRKF